MVAISPSGWMTTPLPVRSVPRLWAVKASAGTRALTPTTARSASSMSKSCAAGSGWRSGGISHSLLAMPWYPLRCVLGALFWGARSGVTPLYRADAPLRQRGRWGMGRGMAGKLLIFGAGGHGRAIRELLRDLGGFDLVGFVDAAPPAG